jgi:hypothetical protein
MMVAPARRTGAGRTRQTLVAAALALAGVVAAGSTPFQASAQLRAGGQLSLATDVFGGTIGIGPRVEFGLPAFPVRLAASGDYFFPDCNQCRYWEGNVNVLVSLPLMPIPFFRYFGGGWHLQSVKASQFEEPTRTRGFNAAVGLNTDNTTIEVRYEILEDIKDQFVFSFAIFLL